VTAQKILLDELHQLPARAPPCLITLPASARVRQQHEIDNYRFSDKDIFWDRQRGHAQGDESSCSYAQVFHSLEFRHGPKSIVNPRSLLGLFISDKLRRRGRSAREMSTLGATTMAVTSQPTSRIRAAADSWSKVPSGSEDSRLAASRLAGQLLGLYTGLKKGLDPDSPRNLSQVVILNERHEGRAAFRHHTGGRD